MEVQACRLSGLLYIKPRLFKDSRGYFYEAYQQARYDEVGIKGPFVQDNVSYSQKDVLRGLHFQKTRPQAKLVSVLQGEVFDVAVDIRKDSPTFGQWEGFKLSAENNHQLFIPVGFAHGFLTLSETAVLHYKCTDYYDPKGEVSLRWDDPQVSIPWQTKAPLLSPKDEAGLWLKDLVL